ncbi:ABC transporter permease [Prauserella marina]|uniref:Peptide/nickel transport system permease protein n=1 Tax=Prauserella marina TaxID=530584 RepID=A0A222VQA3_9PSEU|nr:ABC transporter permease [Prauserella marina]ASR36064.1 ABC transporter permease [Prauserella marina]PWV76791.1 peptide/nickel transport system permease protein [Prauserella marina]SDC97698.1 peptide/nickel transport system permease protein [Prauserella marina]
MIRLAARSAAVLLGSALAGSLVIFLLLRVLGGDAAVVILGRSATPESLAALRAELGLDRSWFVQYTDWLGGLVRGELGRSYAASYDIAGEIGARLGVTLSLALVSIVLAALLALPLGTFAAVNARRAAGGFVDVLTQFGLAIPVFWGGLLLIVVFSIRLGWFPAGGYVPWTVSPLDAVRALTLPVVALTVPVTAVFARYVRAAMLDILDQDFIRTAMAKGRTLGGAAMVHGVRNASVSLLTIGALQLGTLIAGTVVIENVFTLPGLGGLLLSALTGREVMVVQSVAFVIMLIILVLNFLLDLSYGLVDPRIRDREGERA